MKIIKRDAECFQVFVLFGRHSFDEFLRRYPFLSRLDHDRGAVRVCGADINTIVSSLLLESGPYIRLQILDQMAHMDGAVGVRKCAADKNITCGHSGRIGTGLKAAIIRESSESANPDSPVLTGSQDSIAAAWSPS